MCIIISKHEMRSRKKERINLGRFGGRRNKLHKIDRSKTIRRNT